MRLTVRKALKALEELNRRMCREKVWITAIGFDRDWHLQQER